MFLTRVLINGDDCGTYFASEEDARAHFASAPLFQESPEAYVFQNTSLDEIMGTTGKEQLMSPSPESEAFRKAFET